MARRVARAFEYRAGVRVRGSVLACDTSSGSDLIFLSHAHALDGRAVRKLRRPRGGRRQLLTTEMTLALLGPHAERLRPFALVAGYGRPFALGELRVELFPSGHGPGAASLLCEQDGRRVVYAGAVRARSAEPTGAPAHEVRTAAALCIDATFGAKRFSFLDPGEALARLTSFAQDSLAAGATPIVLVDPVGPALETAIALDRAGVALRAHRSIIAGAAAWRHAGLAVPALGRFTAHASGAHAILWPVDERHAPILRTVATTRVALASPLACEPAAVAELRGATDLAVAFADKLDYADLLRYVEATGAREVALLAAPGDELAAALGQRGIDAYPLGPPRQIELFAA